MRVFIGRAGQTISHSVYPPNGEIYPLNPTGNEAEAREQLLEDAKEELKITMGITAEPLFSRVFLWENAMPQYNLGHPEILRHIDTALEKHPTLALAGNGYRGIGIPDCIHSGELAVERILKAFQRHIDTLQTSRTER